MSEVTRTDELLAAVNRGIEDIDLAIPDGKDTPLEGSPYRYPVHSLFISGWHPLAIVRALKKDEGIELALEDVIAFCRTIPREQVQPGALSVYYNNSAYITNPLLDMHKLVLLQQERVMRLVMLEKLEYEKDKSKTISPALSHQLVLLERFQKDLILLEDKVGVNRHAPAEGAPRLATPKTLQQMVEESNKVTMTERTVTFEKGEDAKA